MEALTTLLCRYVVWDTVYRFLSTFDPDTPVYMGSPSPGRHDISRDDLKTWFANGGPGFALSRAAVKALIHRDVSPHGQYSGPSVSEEWLPLIKDECCGDSVVGWTLWNNGVALQGYWPMFNPHPLHGIPFSDRYWCQPIMTLHKTTPKDMVEVWKWEFGQRKQNVCGGPPVSDFSISRSLTVVYSAHYCTPTTGISISPAHQAFWKTGITVTGMRPNLARTKELNHSRNARRRAKKTTPVFSGIGGEETKRNAFSRGPLGMERRDSRNRETTSG